jgi:hypothetical protein
MSRKRLTLAALSVLFAFMAAAAPPAVAGTVILDLRADPLDARPQPLMRLEGAGAGRFAFDTLTRPKFPTDPKGSFVAHVDSTLATARAVAPLGAAYSDQDEFAFGAVFTIRAAGFEADPSGFHPIAFSLINSVTTGFNRTGSLSDFRSDTFDTIDVAYFPQVSPLFGGPFLAPAIFGEPVSDDAFADFAFGSASVELLPGASYLLTAEHHPMQRQLVITAYGIGAQGRLVPLPGGRVVADISTLAGFSVDTLALPLYEDGFNVFTQSGTSVRADVEYDLLFFTPGSLVPAGSMPSLIGALRRSRESARVLPTR